VVSAKWSGRERFGHALATVKRGCMALYVCGGRSGLSTLEDVWASEDNGTSWYCMTQHPPFGCRMDPGLLAVPGRYEHLVLCGGWAHAGSCLQPSGDIWVSLDAGMNWQEVPGPTEWPPRSMPVMAFMPGKTATGSRRLLVLGGVCLSTFQRVNITPGMLSDAWELDIDVEGRRCSWQRLGDAEAGGQRVGFDGRTAAFDTVASVRAPRRDGGAGDHWSGPGALIAGLNGRICMSSPEEPHSWGPAELSGKAERALQQLEGGGALPYFRLASGPRSACQRLFLLTSDRAFASTDSELRWQWRFLLRLGEALDQAGGLPAALWAARVAPALLPAQP